MSEEKVSKEELLSNEDNILKGLLGAIEDNEQDTLTIEIARSGKALFRFDIRGLTEKEYNDLQDKATKYKNNKRMGGVKVAVDTDITKFRSMLIYHATTDKDRENVWDNKQAWNQANVLSGVQLIDKVLKAGEKKRIIDKIDELSGYGDDAEDEDIVKNS